MLEIRHLIPGRIRLKFERVKGHPEFARRIQAHLESVTGIDRVSASPRTGSLLLLYDVQALRSPAFLDEVSEALGKLFPGRFAPGRLRFRVRQLKGKPELARALEMRLKPVRGIRLVRIEPDSGDCQLDYDPKVVASPDFFDALSDMLRAFVPRANPSKLLTLAGFRRR